jgi:F-box and leucine-rich repeat protein GRR1
MDDVTAQANGMGIDDMDEDFGEESEMIGEN